MTYPLGVWQAMLACAYVADKAALGDDGFVATARLAADLGLPAPSAAARWTASATTRRAC